MAYEDGEIEDGEVPEDGEVRYSPPTHFLTPKKLEMSRDFETEKS